ncbi:MAG: hypothetical protein IJX78_02500 [Bacilli bacterium]|nr:hypothetical protein [Bacilli bacterium]
MKKILICLVLLFALCGCGGTTETIEPEKEKILEASCDKTDIYINEIVTINVETNMEIKVNVLNPEILEIKSNQNGEIKLLGIKEGEGEVEILGEEGINKRVTVIVKNYPIPSSINLKLQEEGPYYTGEIYHLIYELEPSNALDNIYLNYNRNYMTINKDTLEVEFTVAGNFNITLYSYDNMEIESTIQVEVDYNPNVEFYRLLFVGNSLTQSTNNNYNIPYIVRDMIQADGVEVICDVNVNGGAAIADQKYTTESFLRKNRYTHVILQEQSAGPIKYFEQFETSVLEIGQMVKENKAKLVLYQTWAYNVEMWNWMTKKEMQAKLNEAYYNVAEKVGASVNPAGEAFETFEAKYGTTPSLYVDMNHASLYGAYLSACVHYASITGRKASENKYIMAGIDYKVMKNIQEIADEVVFGK